MDKWSIMYNPIWLDGLGRFSFLEFHAVCLSQQCAIWWWVIGLPEKKRIIGYLCTIPPSTISPSLKPLLAAILTLHRVWGYSWLMPGHLTRFCSFIILFWMTIVMSKRPGWVKREKLISSVCVLGFAVQHQPLVAWVVKSLWFVETLSYLPMSCLANVKHWISLSDGGRPG